MIIPQPQKIEFKEGNFILNENTVISVSDKTMSIGEYLATELRLSTGLPLSIEICDSDTNQILLSLVEDNKLEDEGYELVSTTDGIKITAQTPAGLFYGCQSLRQLLPPENFSKHAKKVAGDGDPPSKTNEGAPFSTSSSAINMEWNVPCVSITDKPRFKWRGMMLDPCRHFWDIDFVKKLINLMALHKMNIFHWHFTEDQGWRIEIKKYPKLTEIGAWRNEDGKKYGGFYTQEQIRDVVKYAADRFITIVPEIELPGHSGAAISAYPELSCSGKPTEVPITWGVFENVYCAGNENTFTFLEDVISEVMDLFPGKYFHIGGDECPKANWKKCPKCQERIKNENLKNEDELQSYFIKRMENFINKNGKQLIGWDEILEGGLAPNATVMSWRGTEGGIAASKQGHDVIMCPVTHCYFDFPQKPKEKIDIGGSKTVPTKKVYEFEPVPEELSEEEAKHVLGAQGNLWTEHIATVDRAEEMLYPRACALAEKLWSPKDCNDFANFEKRLETHLKRLDVLNVNYFKC
ncbi:beta-N-acetylhexosaminidase [bacterium]|nr:beta-N-acetylhexosaminidase [bacterium]